MNNYIINNRTIALFKDKSNTVVFEEDKKLYVKLSIGKILDNSCRYYGSTHKGRTNGIKEMLKSKYNNPILIEESKNLILFPTESIRNESYALFAYQKIINYEQKEGNKLEILCSNNIMLTINYTKTRLERQIVKCIILNNILNERKRMKSL